VWFHNTQNNQLLSANIGFKATQAAFDPYSEITSRYNTITSGQLVSVDEISSGLISVYPNPSEDGTVKVKSEKEIKELNVFTIVGNKVLTINKLGFESDFNLTNGIYIVKIELIDGSLETVKVVVSK